MLARHDQALAALTRHEAPENVLRLGIPLELPPDLLSGPLGKLAAAQPDTRVQARHASTAAQLDELTAILRSHGVSPGRAFALAPPPWSPPLSDDVKWCPLTGHPLVRRTWAVCLAV